MAAKGLEGVDHVDHAWFIACHGLLRKERAVIPPFLSGENGLLPPENPPWKAENSLRTAGCQRNAQANNSLRGCLSFWTELFPPPRDMETDPVSNAPKVEEKARKCTCIFLGKSGSWRRKPVETTVHATGGLLRSRFEGVTTITKMMTQQGVPEKQVPFDWMVALSVITHWECMGHHLF